MSNHSNRGSNMMRPSAISLKKLHTTVFSEEKQSSSKDKKSSSREKKEGKNVLQPVVYSPTSSSLRGEQEK
eukprot:CAMPEP_0170509052 /NCGR_PEP_ID=MMETSP0208-20121228/64236_1 /TAXON_ID=197538 /ORGANISM="Strombidium inclinatum, Strain S3" /LENGTH=70 /DNA_ID=CAMNT_0010792265 /DNA_START=156 /DNA_END=365 /DNA_ORIENTATION=+